MLQGAWSASLVLSWGQASYATSALTAINLGNMLEAGASREELVAEYRAWQEHFPPFISPGYSALRRRFGLDDTRP